MMAWTIKNNALRHPLRTVQNNGMVINEYSGIIKRFSSLAAATSYVTLSNMPKAEYLEIK